MIGGVADMLKWREQNIDQEQMEESRVEQSAVFYKT